MHASTRARVGSGGVTLAVLAAVLLAGCGAPASPAPPASTTAVEKSPAADGSGPSVDDYDPKNVLLEHDFPIPSNPKDVTTIGVESLVVEGKTMTLKLVVTPKFTSVANTDTVRVFDAIDGLLTPSLVDRTNLKKYSAVDKIDDQVSPLNGTSMLVWAMFAAPEDDIDTVDLRVASSWPEILDIPITR